MDPHPLPTLSFSFPPVFLFCLQSIPRQSSIKLKNLTQSFRLAPTQVSCYCYSLNCLLNAANSVTCIFFSPFQTHTEPHKNGSWDSNNIWLKKLLQQSFLESGNTDLGHDSCMAKHSAFFLYIFQEGPGTLSYVDSKSERDATIMKKGCRNSVMVSSPRKSPGQT